MAQDPSIAEFYQDTKFLVKQDKEADVAKIDAIHERFDYLQDPDKMRGKHPSALYDLPNEERNTEDEVLTTEMSDPDDAATYIRYKMALHEAKESRAAMEEREE